MDIRRLRGLSESDELFDIGNKACLLVAHPIVGCLIRPAVIGVCNSIAPAVGCPVQVPGGRILRLALGNRAAAYPVAPLDTPLNAIACAGVQTLCCGLYSAAVTGSGAAFLDNLPPFKDRIVSNARTDNSVVDSSRRRRRCYSRSSFGRP
jgi:hypothetical protein